MQQGSALTRAFAQPARPSMPRPGGLGSSLAKCGVLPLGASAACPTGKPASQPVLCVCCARPHRWSGTSTCLRWRASCGTATCRPPSTRRPSCGARRSTRSGARRSTASRTGRCAPGARLCLAGRSFAGLCQRPAPRVPARTTCACAMCMRCACTLELASADCTGAWLGGAYVAPTDASHCIPWLQRPRISQGQAGTQEEDRGGAGVTHGCRTAGPKPVLPSPRSSSCALLLLPLACFPLRLLRHALCVPYCCILYNLCNP